MSPKHAHTLVKLRPLSSWTPSSFVIASRCIHSSRPEQAALATVPPLLQHTPPSAPQGAPLSCLPLSQVVRTYLITSVSSSPTLLAACSSVLSHMLHTKSAFTSVERNPILRYILRETFYKQFCGGETRAEVQKSMQQLRNIGYQGVCVEYALEVLEDAKDANEARDVEVWRKALLNTVDMTAAGDFVGLKWSGMGPLALQLLKANKPPTPTMHRAMHDVCDLAASKSVRLLPAAEETSSLAGVDAWSLAMQKEYNRGNNGSIVYNTYQVYLKSAPATLAKHLAEAERDGGFTFGAKLVRGAYLNSERRDLIWSTIEETHAAYDSLTAALLKRQYTGMLQSEQGAGKSFPKVNVVIASHNADSVRKAQALRTEQTRNKEEKVPLIYAQLQGMADEVSCELLQAGKADAADREKVDVPKAYKLMALGSMSECLNYLLRRAAENKDAAGRTYESKVAMAGELRRRFKALFGMA